MIVTEIIHHLMYQTRNFHMLILKAFILIPKLSKVFCVQYSIYLNILSVKSCLEVRLNSRLAPTSVENPLLFIEPERNNAIQSCKISGRRQAHFIFIFSKIVIGVLNKVIFIIEN